MEKKTRGWQLTGLKIYSDPFPSETADRRRLIPEEQSIPPGVIKQVSDIIVTTDLEDRVVYWNNAAEKFYAIPSCWPSVSPFTSWFIMTMLIRRLKKSEKCSRKEAFGKERRLMFPVTEKNRTLFALFVM